MKFTPVSLLSSPTNTKSLVHNKSSSSLLLIKGKSRDLKKLLRYLSGLENSTFPDGTVGCVGQSASSEFPGHGCCASVFPTTFVSYLNDLPSEASLSTASISSL